MAGLAYANGLVIDGAGGIFEVLNAATGSVVFSTTLGGAIYTAPSISNGRIFVGSMNGNVYAFGFPSSGTHTGTITTAGGSSNYSFIPGSSGPSTVGSCAINLGNVYQLSVYDSSGTLLGSGTASSYCNWVDLTTVTAGLTYTVKTVAVSGTGNYRSAWNVNGAQVAWTVGGSLGSGASTTFRFPTLSAGPMTLSSCGPAGTDFDLYLLDAHGATLASSTSPSNCESLTYTPAARDLYQLKEVSFRGNGSWTGTITTE
jgi:hypothetical protein